jgi:hypothetical protein
MTNEQLAEALRRQRFQQAQQKFWTSRKSRQRRIKRMYQIESLLRAYQSALLGIGELPRNSAAGGLATVLHRQIQLDLARLGRRHRWLNALINPAAN